MYKELGLQLCNMYDIILYVNYKEGNMKLYDISVGEFVNLLETCKREHLSSYGRGRLFWNEQQTGTAVWH